MNPQGTNIEDSLLRIENFVNGRALKSESHEEGMESDII